ncbi:hypothetical protein N7510_006950 [Penicillium lagena]|uniref:uncharacterized protein n=1 Tax=Penicillium lagena TaxID=94218 RepID=UPI0025400F4D|nr:uncharacterized protein N7510_006950 [Penicillium lagena]KAJ5610231.1 hypothetical protein N7510_006950 [Penicillium lagena]
MATLKSGLGGKGLKRGKIREVKREDTPTASWRDSDWSSSSVSGASASDERYTVPAQQTTSALTMWLSPSGIPCGMAIDDYRLLHHWTTTLCPLLSVASTLEKNPFLQHLAPMAYDPGPLRHIILYMAAKHLAVLHGQYFLERDMLRHHTLAVRYLSQALDDAHEAVSDSTLASILLMQQSAIFVSDADKGTRADHLAGAKWIITRRTDLVSSLDPRRRFLLSLFRYHDIMSSISRGDAPLLNSSDGNTNSLNLGSNVDLLLGRISSLLLLISEISVLQTRKKSTESEIVDTNLIAIASLIESKLQIWTPVTSNTDWTNTAEAYRHAAFIYLYRVTYNIGAPHPLTIHHVRLCLDALHAVPASSTLSSVLVWPIFTAGCESIDATDRDFCRQRLRDMYWKRRLESLLRVLGAIEDVWEQKDQESMEGIERAIRVDCIGVLKGRRREIDLV